MAAVPPKNIFPYWPDVVITIRLADGLGDNSIDPVAVSGEQTVAWRTPKNEWVGLRGGLDGVTGLGFLTYRYSYDINDDAATSYMVLNGYRGGVYPNDVLIQFGQWGHRIQIKIHLRAITLTETVTDLFGGRSYAITSNTPSELILEITESETDAVTVPATTFAHGGTIGSTGDEHILLWESIEVPILA